jgi:BASS family bile acid:Na+ symporter
LVIALHVDEVFQVFGTHGILASGLLAILGLGVGWLLGGPGTGTRRLLSLSAGLRNFAVALVVAAQGFNDLRVEITVIGAAVIGLMIALPLSRAWGVRAATG